MYSSFIYNILLHVTFMNITPYQPCYLEFIRYRKFFFDILQFYEKTIQILLNVMNNIPVYIEKMRNLLSVLHVNRKEILISLVKSQPLEKQAVVYISSLL